MDVESIWEQLQAYRSNGESVVNDIKTPASENVYICKQCLGTDLYASNNDLICYGCGLVVVDFCIDPSQNTFEKSTPRRHTQKTQLSTRLQKMQDWYMWSNDEKNAYKLTTYTKSICQRLQIPEMLIVPICNTVVDVMNVIKKHDGTKRARVKDGIIVACMYYVSKNTEFHQNTNDLAKKMNLDVKYVTKAEKIILELVNLKKLNINKKIVLDTKNSFDYVTEVIKKNNINVSESILTRVHQLIRICENKDLLLDHTPLSVGVCCFYYVLKEKDISIDLKFLSDLYSLSVVTIVKTYNKLKLYDDLITSCFSQLNSV
jgi:transcription initiation factor TFIIIB Brf1 subunit/transcription initiation factor TFIIB